MRPRCLSLAVLALCSLAAAPFARADKVLASNLGPGQSYSVAYYPAGDFFGVVQIDYAIPFTIQGHGSYFFTAAQAPLALDHLNTGPNSVDFLLLSNASGTPGSTLESITVNNTLPSSPFVTKDNPALITASSTLHPKLKAGTQYWLVVDADGATEIDWNQNGMGQTGHNLARSGPGGVDANGVWTPASGGDIAFQIRGVAVPEASTLLSFGGMLVFGLAAGYALRRRRQIDSTILF